MIDLSLLCKIQRKKIVACFFIIAVAFFSVLFVQFTLVGKTLYLRSVINEKRNKIDVKKNNLSNIEKSLKLVKKEKSNWNLRRKNGFYDGFNKHDFILALQSKINGDDNLDDLDFDNQKKTNVEYSSLNIVLNSFAEGELYNKIRKKINLLKVVEKQKVDITLDENLLKISFKADYEYGVYRILDIIMNALPGYVLVKNVNIQPVLEDTKQFLYRRKFYKSEGEPNMDNRLTCEIELLWFFLSSPFTKKMIEDEGI